MSGRSMRQGRGVLLGLGVAAPLLLLTHALPVALVFGAAAGAVPTVLTRRRETARRHEIREVWPDAVDDIASAVRAGMSLPEAVGALAERGPEVLVPAFERFALDHRGHGSFAEALDRLQESLADVTGDRVVEGLRIARDVGGGQLGRLLRDLAQQLRDDLRTRSELEARQAGSVTGARLAVAAPWVVLVLMCFQPDVIRHYATPAGGVVIAVTAVLGAGAYAVMVRVARLPEEPRVAGVAL